MRAFIAGLVCGAVVCAGAVSWLNRNPSSGAADEIAASTVEQCSDSAAPVPSSPISQSPKRTDHQAQQPVAATIPSDPASRSALAESDGTDGSATPDASQCVITDSNVDEIFSRAMRQRADREKRSLEAEPKDPMWSAAMEQQVREGFSGHALGDRFTISHVECKTLFCDVKAQVPMSSAQEGIEAFRRATTDVAQSLDLRVGGSGSGGDLSNGLVDAHVRFRRFKPGDECPPGLKQDCWNR